MFRCPRRRARVLAVLHMRNMDVTAIAFGSDAGRDVQDLVAFIAPNGGLLALERLTWKGPDTGELSTRPAMMMDRTHIALARNGSSRQNGAWRRESWKDYLRLDGARLADAPPPAVMPDTWQSLLAAERAQIAASMPTSVHSVPSGALIRFRQSPFMAGEI